MNYYPHHIGDYSRDTAHLSMLEDAAYRRMLDLYYASERPLPMNRQGLYRLVRAKSKAEQNAVDVILGEFFIESEAGWRNARADTEIARAQEKSIKARASANASVEARQRTGKEVRAQRMAAAKAKGTHTNEDWLLLVDLCGKKCVKCGADSPLDRDHVLPVYKGGSDAITNLQPLCAPCNSSKGPEAFDYVPHEIRSAFAQRSLNEGSTPNNQQPIAKNQEPNKRVEAPQRSRGSRLPPEWVPSEVLKAWAGKERPDLDMDKTIESFRDYWHSKPGASASKLDWEKTFKNWVRAEKPGTRTAPPDYSRIMSELK